MDFLKENHLPIRYLQMGGGVFTFPGVVPVVCLGPGGFRSQEGFTKSWAKRGECCWWLLCSQF